MAEVIPFRGIFYDGRRVRCSDVIAPPYDIITPELRERLYSRSPYNVVRIDSGKDLPGDNETENKYTRAERHLEAWLKQGILTRSRKPAFYACRMDYEIKGHGETLTGFFGLVRLEQLGQGDIYPHEETHAKPKRDRLALMDISNANTSPIFSLYHSPVRGASEALEAAIAGAAPLIEAEDLDGTLFRVWAVDEEASIEAVKSDLSDKAVFIADGHHRYETALDYQRAMRQRPSTREGVGPFDYVLMFLANTEDGGLTILPTHRLLKDGVQGELMKRLPEYFELDTLPADADIIDAIKDMDHCFGLYLRGRQYRVKYKGGDLDDVQPALRTLDVVILQEMIFRRLLGISEYGYEMNFALAKAKVDGGEYGAAFFLNPTPVGAVEEVALSSLRMPPKSTYFYPKIPTGLVINSLISF
jgi:uncharacterized protein (DUF1015 family)